MDTHFYVFPAVRGIQAGREYYIAMCPLKLIPKIFLFDEEEIPPELRAQRNLNRARIPDLTRYLVDNPKNYVFSALTSSVDGQVEFIPVEEKGEFSNLGQLKISMSARFLINDGQHRRAAIEECIRINSDLGDETISVVFFLDEGLKNSQQMFADLNRHAVRPTRSLSVLYDHRDELSKLTIDVSNTVDIFQGMTETEKTTISNRSRKLFTLSSIYQGTSALLGKSKHAKVNERERKLAIEFWHEISKHMNDWTLAKEGKISSAELRRDYIHSHALIIHVFGIVGRSLITKDPDTWQDELAKLRSIDWRRTNSDLWEGRATIGGKVSKARTNVILTTNHLKNVFALELTEEEQNIEDQFLKGRNVPLL